MNLLTAGILAYVGSQVYLSMKRKAFTLTIAVPRGWVEVDEGMFRAAKSDRAVVILHKTPEEVLQESQHYQPLKSSLPGKMVQKDDNTFIYFYIDQKNNQGYVLGFSNMNIAEISVLCSTIKPV